MSDQAKIVAENQKEVMKLIEPMAKKSSAHQNVQDSDSETENNSVARTFTPVKTNTATSKTTPINIGNMVTGVLNDSTNQPTKSRNNNAHTANELEIVPPHQDYCLHHSHKHSSQTTYSQCRKLSQLCYPSLTLSLKKLNFSKKCSKITSKCTPTLRN